MRLLLIILLICLVLPTSAQERLVKKRTEASLLPYTNDKGKQKEIIQIERFTVYDKQGRVIEYGRFGEASGNQIIVKDSSITWYCSKDNSKIRSVDFTTYDKDGRIFKEETWFFKNNKKDWRSSYKIYLYNELGFLFREINFSNEDSIEKSTTYIYDNNLNNIEIIDSSFNSFFTEDKVSIHKSINQFDNLKRKILTTEFSNGKMLLRRKYLYRDEIGLTTELRYDNESDTSLWSITEIRTRELSCYPFPKKKYEVFTKIINSNTENRKIYFYNKDCLLDKIDNYSGAKLNGHTIFNYEYY